MDLLNELLKEHGLASHKSLSRDLARFGRDRFRSLLEALCGYTPPPSPPRPGRLVFFPAGGRLGLGSGERGVRGLILIADHIVLPYDLGRQAASMLSAFERGGSPKAFDDLKGRSGIELHPYLHQYMKLKLLVDEGLVSLCPPPAPPLDLVHPMANALKQEFLRWVDYGVDGKGKPWMVLTVGPRCWSAYGDLRVGPSTIAPQRPFESTDDLPHRDQGFRPAGPGVRQANPEDLLSGSHPLTEAFENFISVELFRAQLLTQAADKMGASLATDADSDWEILGFLASRSETADPLQAAGTLVQTLTDSLPFMRDVPIAKLVELRVDNGTEFDNLRSTLLRASRDVAEEPDLGQRYRRAAEVVVGDIMPRLARYNANVTALARKRGLAAATAAGAAASVALMWALFGVELASAPVSGALATTAGTYLKSVIEAQRQIDEAKGDPMFFLWKLKNP
jgi:hypothetical protein